MSIIPAPVEGSKPTISSVRLPKGTWQMLDKIAAHESAKPKAVQIKKTFSRNEIIESLLNHGIAAYWAAEGKPGGDAPERRAKPIGRRRDDLEEAAHQAKKR